MSLIITPLRAFADNYIWTLINTTNKQAIVIDPGQAQPVIDYLESQNLELTAIWITHRHHDHVGGVDELREHYPMTHVVAHSEHGVNPDQTVNEGSSVSAWGYNAQVWAIPGHTEHHLAYLLDKEGVKQVFCGDTLFSGGCGRVFTGTMTQLYHSLQRINTLDEGSVLYPAHEYTSNNLRFGLTIEPDNAAMRQSLFNAETMVADGKPSLPVQLANERIVNVFLRVDKPSVINGVSMQTALEDTKPLTVFTALRTLKDSF